jgi:putative AlgH/UPF0301 family transcriptional regulator
LDDEISQKAWWVGQAGTAIVFDSDLELMWKNIVKGMGENFSYMAEAPEDRTWN